MMSHLAEMFRSGGVFMYLILLGFILLAPLALATIGISVARLVKGGFGRTLLITSVVTLVGSAFVVLVGFLGYQMGISEVEAALEMVPPERAAEMRAKGMELARYTLDFSLYTAALPALAGIMGLVARFAKKDDPHP